MNKHARIFSEKVAADSSLAPVFVLFYLYIFDEYKLRNVQFRNKLLIPHSIVMNFILINFILFKQNKSSVISLLDPSLCVLLLLGFYFFGKCACFVYKISTWSFFFFVLKKAQEIGYLIYFFFSFSFYKFLYLLFCCSIFCT